MASQRQHRSRLAARLGKLRRALAQVSMLAGSVLALGSAAAAHASVQLERQTLEARVQAVRAMLQMPAPGDAVDSVDGVDAVDAAGKAWPVRTAQWFNWSNWNNWNNWKNWGNWLNR